MDEDREEMGLKKKKQNPDSSASGAGRKSASLKRNFSEPLWQGGPVDRPGKSSWLQESYPNLSIPRRRKWSCL